MKKRKSVFVLIVPRFEDISHSYFAGEIIKGVSLSISRLNADFVVHIVDRSQHKNWLDSTLLDPRYIAGILFADIENDVTVVSRAIRAGIPCLVLNNILSEPINYVAVDNKKAACEVMSYLIGKGHRSIATIAGDIATQSGLLRLEGYRETLLKEGISVPRQYIAYGHYLRTPARQAAQKILKLKERPTAIFAASDVMALEVMDVARSLNIKIPEELSVVGFDNNPNVIFNKNSEEPIPLTTVAQPLVEMGRLGLEDLALITVGKAKLPVKEILSTKLIERGSTAACKG